MNLLGVKGILSLFGRQFLKKNKQTQHVGENEHKWGNIIILQKKQGFFGVFFILSYIVTHGIN